jgi:polypyrimidine tract-binding protein 2
VIPLYDWQVQMGGASAAAAVFGGVLPPGITGTNDRSTLLASNLLPEVKNEWAL